jgi:hypothetical protein
VGIHFVALDALDGPRADFAAFRQPLLRQAFLLPQFRYFESEVGLVHGLLLSIFIPHSRNHAQTFNVVYTTFLFRPRHSRTAPIAQADFLLLYT